MHRYSNISACSLCRSWGIYRTVMGVFLTMSIKVLVVFYQPSCQSCSHIAVIFKFVAVNFSLGAKHAQWSLDQFPWYDNSSWSLFIYKSILPTIVMMYFQWRALLPSSGSSCPIFFPVLLDPEDGSCIFVKNFSKYLEFDMASHPRRLEYSSPQLWAPKICRVIF